MSNHLSRTPAGPRVRGRWGISSRSLLAAAIALQLAAPAWAQDAAQDDRATTADKTKTDKAAAAKGDAVD
ncbi:hypothetical protein R0J87_19715, partial [Halomonas sp. SIMBA_159]